ncbi:hypothetical protein [Desertivirga xinjiangensis]|uniref:hypothetical protein n=1 Tax=Desertivirga xinjiangensis TaxID=539206 RepID=UPI00210BB67B|nr:hypothetical protein [Pedobacter xinjiangensis]
MTITKMYRIIATTLATGLILTFNACKKDDPEPEVAQEEFKSVVFNFIELEADDDHFHETTDTVKIVFGADGNATRSHYDLHADAVYRLKVVAYDFAGREMQDEFVEEADEHQMFITGAQEGVLDYTYEDDKVGVTGRLSTLKPSDGSMTLTAVLRHGLDKSKTTAADWDDANHVRFGGSADFTLKFPLHVVEGDHDDH